MNAISKLFGCKYPIVQGGMVWNSGWRLASAVSNAGGLGLLGAGSMHPEVLKEQILKCKKATSKPFGVNVPLLYPSIEEHMQTIIEQRVPIVFTSAGNPKIWTKILQEEGIKVVQVVSSVKFALKSQEAGVDAVVGEGFEAGGHNGREETTTFCLLPDMKKHLDIPIIAAGGIATGAQILAAQILGADGVQLGSRFVATHEASSHRAFKEEVVKAKEGATQLTLKELTPARVLKNAFYDELVQLYDQKASTETIQAHLGKGRAKRGMFEGDLTNGELEIGQCASLIDEILFVDEVFSQLLSEYEIAKQSLPAL